MTAKTMKKADKHTLLIAATLIAIVYVYRTKIQNRNDDDDSYAFTM